MALTSVSAASTPDYTQSFSVLRWEIVATSHDTVLESKSTSVLPSGIWNESYQGYAYD